LLTLGNGASELIDLITRIAPQGSFKPGPFTVKGVPVQYKEYQRASEANDRVVLKPDDKTPEAIRAIINPSNPTGDFLPLVELREYIEKHCAEGSFVMVDESMLPWEGPNWREQSLVSAIDWMQQLYREKNISVWVIHSWTKLWSCPGIRVGSVVAATQDHLFQLKKKQVPWSLNCCALSFLNEVVKDEEFLTNTWEINTAWRAYCIKRLEDEHPTWNHRGTKWISWIWIDLGDEETTQKAISLAKNAGVPVRPGSQGYDCPTCIRIGIRDPKYQNILFKAWETLK